MSFSSNAKAEICRFNTAKKCCTVAEAYGVLLFCNTFSPKMIKIVTESQEFAAMLPKLFKKAFNMTFDKLPDEKAPSTKLTFFITDADKLERIFQTYGFSVHNSVTLHVNLGVLENECCCISFLRGAFLAGGSVTDPAKGYHLELATTHYKVCREVYTLMQDIMGVYPKATDRNGNSILYFKQSDYIEDFLTMVGAPVAAMGIMEAKVEKDKRNEVNRRVNCEFANISKTVDAAQEQLKAIRRLEQSGMLEKLPPKLYQTAMLRKKNPEMNLTDLAKISDPTVTKSAMNHRLRKLIELSKQ